MVLSGDQPSQQFQRKPIYVNEISIVQKWLIFSILAKMFCIPLYFVVMAIDLDWMPMAALAYVLAGIAVHISVIALAAKLYSMWTAILLGIATFIPILGLGIMLWVNAAASKAMREQGVKVGLFGARS